MICRPSVISDDWVVKGFHLHVHGIELAVRPGHQRGLIVFRSVFSSPTDAQVAGAAAVVAEKCLADREIRAQWRHTIDGAIDFLDGYNGELGDLANGRKAELNFLKRALMARDQGE